MQLIEKVPVEMIEKFTELSKEKKLTIEDLKSTYRILQNCNGSENCSEIDCFEFLKSEIEYSYDDYMFTITGKKISNNSQFIYIKIQNDNPNFTFDEVLSLDVISMMG